MQAIKCKCKRIVLVTKDCVRCGCGETVYRDNAKHQLIPSNPCMHRGESTRAVECNSCKGMVKVKVFPCDLHEECTIKKRAGDLKTCYGCVDHELPISE